MCWRRSCLGPPARDRYVEVVLDSARGAALVFRAAPPSEPSMTGNVVVGGLLHGSAPVILANAMSPPRRGCSRCGVRGAAADVTR